MLSRNKMMFMNHIFMGDEMSEIKDIQQIKEENRNNLLFLPIILLLSLTFLIITFNTSSLAETGKIPDPRISIQVDTPTPTTTSATFLNGKFAKQGDIVDCYITLTNLGEDANGGGVFIQLDGAEFLD